jgi:hypothetical protein
MRLLISERLALGNSCFPTAPFYVPIWFEESHMNKPTTTSKPCSTAALSDAEWLEEVTKELLPKADQPAATPETIKLTSPFARHDGWTGEKMAIFCETLAETAVVAEACEAAGKHISGAYALRRRNPYFAAAWDAALTIARERLADTLLARSMEGNIEQIWRDGEVVGERHLLDNRLGLAILKRLDRLAETGLSLHSNTQEPKPPAIAARSSPVDWELAIDALRTGDEKAVCKALALFKDHKVEEIEDPLNRPPSPAGEPREIDYSHRFWESWRDGEKTWFTDFPPPAGFTGYESCDYGDPEEEYERECSAQEIEILDADAARAREAGRAEEAGLRDQWLALLKEECAAAGS